METPHGNPVDPTLPQAAPPETTPTAAVDRGPVPSSPVCVAHPRQPAVTRCASCGKQLCSLCTFDLGGWDYCGDCGLRQADLSEGRRLCLECGRSMPADAETCECGRALEKPVSVSPPARRWKVQDGACVNHPGSPAVITCGLCARSICATCDFALPGDIHVCPSCIEAQANADASPKRKNWSYLALGLAAWSTLLFVLLVGGLFNSIFESESGDAASAAVGAAILWPSVIGTGIALVAREKRLKNTGLMNAAVWWNAIVAGIFILLIIVGNLGLVGE